MKKIKIRTDEAMVLYNILNNSRYGKLDDADKVKVWKITRSLKPVAKQFDEDSKDAAEKFKPSDYEKFTDDLQKYVEYQQRKGVGCQMTLEEYQAFTPIYKNYQDQMNKALKEFSEKEVEVEFDTITEDAFTKFMNSNEWNFAQAVEVGEKIVG